MKQLLTLLAAVLLTATTYAQVGIGTTTPDASSALDITSTTKGLLIPRMKAAERDVISSAATGLMIFCTDCASGEGELQVYYVSGWKNAANTVLDTTPPVISVTAGTDTVEQGATWTDAGATSDGDETVTVSGTIETSTAGTYTITYTATDTAGNVGTAKRIVTVLDTTTIPVILIKWNDLDFETEQLSFGGESRNGTFTDVYNLFNGDNYNYPKNNPEDTPTGSAKEYFKTISHGSWNPKWEIINASDNTSPSSLNEYAYNIDGNHINYGETNDSNGTALKPQLLAAYNKAVINYGSENFDKLWGKQNIIFIHSGYGAETPVDNRLNYVWSHYWVLGSNGETIKYAISPYKKENSVGGVKYTNIIPINWTVQSTLNHFGLPDLYDTDFSSKGAGYLSVIASGSWGVDSGSPWLPALASPYTRSKLSRFFTANIIEINDTATDLSLPPINITDKSYKLTIPGNTNEYWLLENKKAAGFDRKLNEEGIVIWHVVENVNNNNNEFPSNKRGESGYKMSLEASDGLFNLERKKNNFNGSRLWTTGQEFSPYSSPSSVMENGNPTGIRVYNIRKDGDNMLFDVEYITEPFNTITNIDLNTTSKILTITTTGLIGESLEIGFNNNDYKSVNVSSETMEIDLKNEPYLTLFNNNIRVNQNNGFNTLNIRAAADSFTNDMSGRPFSYNYTFEFIGPESPVSRTSQIKPSAKGLNQNEDKMIKFKQTNKK